MPDDTIQIRTAVKMFIQFLLEHRNELEQEMSTQQRQELRLYRAKYYRKRMKDKSTANNAAEPS